MAQPVITTTPVGPNAPQWAHAEKKNGSIDIDIRANAFPGFLREVGQRPIQLADEQEKTRDSA